MADSRQTSLDFWRQELEEKGIAWVRTCAATSMGEDSKAAALAVIAEYEEKQEDKRASIRDEREEKTLKLAEEANQIAKATKKEMRYTWAGAVIIGILTIIFSILLEQGGNAP